MLAQQLTHEVDFVKPKSSLTKFLSTKSKISSTKKGTRKITAAYINLDIKVFLVSVATFSSPVAITLNISIVPRTINNKGTEN